MRTDFLRTRWAALGAAVAVSLGAGGIGLVNAETSSGAMPVYIAINPCRLADTRPEFQVGPRATSIGANEEWTLNGWGAAGNCTLPADTSALALNVTAVGATAPTFLQLFPGDGTRPSVGSNLNPGPGQPPTPNAVLVDLSDSDGTFKLYNAFGAVNIIVDVVGYYDDHVHTGDDIVDGSLTGVDIQDNTVSNVDTSNEPGIAFTNKNAEVALTTTAAIVSSVAIRPPTTGYVTVQATAFWYSNTVDRQIVCQITDGTSTIAGGQIQLLDTDPSAGDLAASISLVQTFVVPAFTGLSPFSGQNFNLVCRSSNGPANINDIHMTATFHASSYAPLELVLLP